MFRVVFLVSLVLYIEYVAGGSIKDNDDIIPLKPEVVPININEADMNNVESETPSIVALQAPGGGSRPGNCAGIGQACSSHGDCCTSSCFGILRTCIPNLGIALNIQIGREDQQP